MGRVIYVDEFKQHMGELADRAATNGDVASVLSYRMLVDILDIYADIYGKDSED